MTFAYLGSIDFVTAAELDLTTVQIAKSGDPTYSLNLSALTAPTADTLTTTTVLNHSSIGLGSCVGEDRFASTLMRSSYSVWGLGFAMSVALGLAATDAGATPGIGFVFDAATLTYTISGATGATITFGSDMTAWLFGFSSTTLSGASTHTSDITPWGIIVPVLTDVSEPTTNYEPESIAIQAVSAGNAVVGLQRSSVPLYRDWVQQYETKEKTLRLSALDAHPFTHQALFEQHRTSLPFCIVDGFAEEQTECFYLRGDGSAWKTDRATAANDTQFHVQYRTVVAGLLVAEEFF